MNKVESDSTTGRRAAFGRALLEAMAIRGMSQRPLAEAVGLTQGAVSGWTTGNYEPDPATVFQVEEILELPPGHLSQHLGYLPLNARAMVDCNFERAVLSDPDLTNQMKRALLSFYKTALETEASRPGRRRRADAP